MRQSPTVSNTGGVSLRLSVSQQENKPHIVMVIPRGEAVRNFLYSDTLRVLSENARVTLLSVIHDYDFRNRFGALTEAIIPLKDYPENRLVGYLEDVLLHAHYRWLWSEKAKNKWEILDHRASTFGAKLRLFLWKAFVFALANRPSLRALTALHRFASWTLRPTDDFDKLFMELKPDLVFNCSHIHSPAADLPMMVAHRMDIPTATFIFSWDNLTTRSRILVPYDYYLVWHQGMRDQLLSIYPSIEPERVFVTGTPQFDFHFQPQFWLSKEDLCARLGADPNRPIVFYTTGMASDFPEEHRHVEFVIETLQELNLSPNPQLIVRTYVKGTSPEMNALAQRNLSGVIFPPVLWDEKWFTPQYEDLFIYTSLLRHASLGINAASTVSLELMMHDKPVINIGFDPPGSQLPHCYRWIRHIDFDHYQPVAVSGATMIARSETDLRNMVIRGLTEPQADSEKRRRFISGMFGSNLDGNSGKRVAEQLIKLAGREV
jgi:hypothetical protein